MKIVLAAIALVSTGATAQTVDDLKHGAAYAGAFCLEEFPKLEASNADELAALAQSDVVDFRKLPATGPEGYHLAIDYEVPGYGYLMELEESGIGADERYNFTCAVTIWDDGFDKKATRRMTEEFEANYAEGDAGHSYSLATKHTNNADDLTIFKRREPDARGCPFYISLSVQPERKMAIFAVGGLMHEHSCGGPSILKAMAGAQ